MASPTQTKSDSGAEKYADINWDELGFDLVPADYMYVTKCDKEENFTTEVGNIIPYANIAISPFAGILNYGQGLLEGLKAYRRDDGRVLLFRPEQNAQRMQIGAERLCMPSPSIEHFVEAVKQTVLANKHWVPPPGKGSLYVRPLLIGSGPVLSLVTAPEISFLIYACPVGNYHKVYKAIAQAKARGFSDVLFLDAVTKKYIEEVSSCNIFIVKGNVISTPAICGTILPGITRKSIIEIALGFGYQVEERVIPLVDLFDVDEVFCTGTAVVVSPVASITYGDKRIEYKTGAETVSKKLYDMLTGIQTGRIEDKMGWTVEID
ncbi:putative branched-chain-amino-acid aminotransferase 7 isoform X2 [Quercus suber]|uniref:putative branched-chain-amino-acid aminotransferase 7 isoform X2 n=1 Tax=Quercus suber TaxID=58331 RepID=UPI0032DF380C